MDFEELMAKLGIEPVCETCRYWLPCGETCPDYGWCCFFKMKNFAIDLPNPSLVKTHKEKFCEQHEVD